MRNGRELGKAALFYAVLAAIFFHPFLLRGDVFLPGDFLYHTPAWYDPRMPLHNFDLFDAILIFFPLDVFLHDSFQQGHMPFWNPFIFQGFPQWADGQCGFLYPPNLLLYGLFSSTTGHNLNLLLHTWVGGLAMYAWARRLGQSPAAALLAGTAWMFNGVNLVFLEEGFSPRFTALLPLALLAVDRAREKWRWLPAGAGSVGLILVCGHLQWALYSLFVLALMMLWRVGSSGVGWRRVAAAFMLGGALAAPTLLPTLQLVSMSQRPTIPESYLRSSYVEALQGVLPTLVAPNCFGSPVDDFALKRVTSGGYWIYPELCAYAGVVPLLLALWGAAGKGLPRAMAATVAVIVLVPATPLYTLVYHLPGLNHLIATRLGFVWVFAVALLAGFGLDRARAERPAAALSWVCAALWAGAVAWIHGFPSARAAQWLVSHGRIRLPDAEIFGSPSEHLNATAAAFGHAYSWDNPSVWQPLLWMLLAGGALALKPSRAREAALIALTAMDLLAFGMRFNTVVPEAAVLAPNPTTAFLQRNLGVERFMALGTIRPNSFAPFGLQDVSGYTSFYPRSTAAMLSTLETGRPDPGLMSKPELFPLHNAASPVANLLGVRYFITYPQARRLGVGTHVVQSEPLPIYENERRLPRAFLATQWVVTPAPFERLSTDLARTVLLEAEPPLPKGARHSGTATITDYRPERVDLSVDSPDGGLVVLTDTFYPGWSATVDGNPTPILRAYGSLRAVPVGPGPHRITESFEPEGFRTGCWIALAAFALALAGLAL